MSEKPSAPKDGKTITHSCCPAKRDINAPTFRCLVALRTSTREIEEWQCQGCKTVIYIATPTHD